MERARNQGIPAVAISPKETSDQEYQSLLLKTLANHKADLICLAGYMRVLGQEVVNTYRGRIMNVHPALIPSFCGKGMYGIHVHEAAIARGVRFSGCTVHFVDEDYDTGPIIVQKVVPVDQDDTPETLAAKILPYEHEAYIEAIRLFVDGKLIIEGRKVRIL